MAHAALGMVSLLRGGVVGAVANAVAVAALADLRRDAARSAAVLAAALAPLGAPAAAPGGRILAARAARTRYRQAADIAYGEDPAQRLDVWARADLDPAGRAPVLVQVHGGGWTGGDKSLSGARLMAHLAERGWVCVTVNYRLGPGERWPAMIVDVKRALAWVRGSIAGFGGDPGFVAISGGSAGGHLASLVALSPNDPAFQPGFADADTSVAAAVPLYGVHDFSIDEHGLFALLEGKVIGTTHDDDADTWRRASPLHRAGPHAPPFLVVHGSTDTMVSVGQSRRFVQRLRQVSDQPVLYAELPHAQHGFDAFATARTAHTVRAVHRFLTVVHDRHRAGVAQEPATVPR
jgi:acetyl esterase/lipase